MHGKEVDISRKLIKGGAWENATVAIMLQEIGSPIEDVADENDAKNHPETGKGTKVEGKNEQGLNSPGVRAREKAKTESSESD